MDIIDKAIEQIKQDLEFGALSAVEELLKEIPEERLKAFLEEG